MFDGFNDIARFRLAPIMGILEGDRRRLPVTFCGDIVDNEDREVKEDKEDEEDVDMGRGNGSISCGHTV